MKTPIYNGLAQSDLDCANYKLLRTDLSDYAGAGLTWNTVTKKFDITSSGGLPASATAIQLLGSSQGTRTSIDSLATGLGNFFDSQSFDPCIIVNPLNTDELIMFFSGMAAPIQTGAQTIGRATASITDATTWTVDASAVLTPSLAWETGGDGLRADSIIYNPADAKLYLFYTAKYTTIGVASSDDLGLTWTKLGQVLTPSGDEVNVSQFGVLLDGSTLHAIYAYRTAGLVLPAYRYASASTSDWLTWTKGGGDVYSDPEPNRYHEFHQLLKVGSTYIICYESGSTTVDYDIRFATSSDPSTGWVVSLVTPYFTKSAEVGAFDRYHVSTPHVHIINGYWYLFYSGAMDHSQPYGTNHWQMGVVPLLYG